MSTFPPGLLFAMAGGWLIGSLVVLAAGAPQRNPSADDVVRGLDEAGVHLKSMKRAGVDARGSTPYFGVDIDGNGLFIKVLGADERDADLLFRVYRWFRLSGVGDERPFSSLRRTVEHEALVSMTAERSGLVTPPVRAVVELPDRSMALVYKRIDGHSSMKSQMRRLRLRCLRGSGAKCTNFARRELPTATFVSLMSSTLRMVAQCSSTLALGRSRLAPRCLTKMSAS